MRLLNHQSCLADNLAEEASRGYPIDDIDLEGKIGFVECSGQVGQGCQRQRGVAVNRQIEVRIAGCLAGGSDPKTQTSQSGTHTSRMRFTRSPTAGTALLFADAVAAVALGVAAAFVYESRTALPHESKSAISGPLCTQSEISKSEVKTVNRPAANLDCSKSRTILEAARREANIQRLSIRRVSISRKCQTKSSYDCLLSKPEETSATMFSAPTRRTVP